MLPRRTFWRSLLALPLLSALRMGRAADNAPAAMPSPTGGPGMEMLTLFLRHDQSKTVEEINQHLKSTGWFRDFPPSGVEVVSWYVLMGIGQVVTLRFASEKLRDINRLVEEKAWGGFRTEFYATYDFKTVYRQMQDKFR